MFEIVLAAAGIVNAVRRPAARRVLVMVVVASALFVFCLDALVTGQHNRQSAAEQANGAHYSLAIQTARLTDVVAALAEVDPDHRHLTPIVTTSSASLEGPTVAVDAAAFPRIAYLPADTDPDGWAAIAAPRVDPVRLTGSTLAGSVVSSRMRLKGPSATRTDDLTIGLQLIESDGESHKVELSVIPLGAEVQPFSVSVRCVDGCVVTGLAVSTPHIQPHYS